jgi:Chemotaxis protein histidine kinase and related kinases
MNNPMVPERVLREMLLKEWTECAGGLESRILRLEVNSRDGELMEEILETICRVKRGSAYIGATGVTKIVHELESALRTMGDLGIRADAELIDLLLLAVEALGDGLRAFGDALAGRGPLAADGPFAPGTDAEAKWSEVACGLRAYFDRAHPGAPAAGGGADAAGGAAEMAGGTADGTDAVAAGDADAANENAVAADDADAANENAVAAGGKANVTGDAGEADAGGGAGGADAAGGPDRAESGESGNGRGQTAILARLPGGTDGRPGTAADPALNAAQLSHHPQSIRVSQDKLDKMMNMISELLIAKNAFMHLSARLNVEYDLPELSKEVKDIGFSVNRITDELQNAIMSIRMVEIRTVFQKMPRIVRDVAHLTGKKMELAMAGETTEIDKTIVEQISDPLVHLIRNAADHGIEDAEERLRKGKSETGRIELRAYNKDKHVYIEIEDDGKGIDPEALKRKAVERGLIAPDQAERMSGSQLVNLIFLPGFSTAGRITEVSGRGVGMDIVKSNIEKLGGTVFIDSEVDRGTKVVIRLPLTLAISRGLIVNVARESYIIPIEYISETVKIGRRDIHRFDGKFFARHKGSVIGVEWLAKLFLLGDRDPDGKDEFHAVIISGGGEKFGIIVDKLLSEQEFVIKALHGRLAGIPGISGSTLLGDGQVVLIVNPLDLIRLAKNG